MSLVHAAATGRVPQERCKHFICSIPVNGINGTCIAITQRMVYFRCPPGHRPFIGIGGRSSTFGLINGRLRSQHMSVIALLSSDIACSCGE